MDKKDEKWERTNDQNLPVINVNSKKMEDEFYRIRMRWAKYKLLQTIKMGTIERRREREIEEISIGWII